jgi:hypothetical protein
VFKFVIDYKRKGFGFVSWYHMRLPNYI